VSCSLNTRCLRKMMPYFTLCEKCPNM